MSIIQITKSGTKLLGSKKDLKKLQEEFDKNHCIKLAQFLEPSLLKFIQNELNKNKFYEDKYKVGKVNAVGFLPSDKTIVSLLHFLVNDSDLFQLIQGITDCSKVGCFTGRVYSKIPGLGQYDSWHDDLSDNRMVSMSINLSKGIYSGGILQICDAASKKIIHEVANTGFGDGIIFRISPKLKHRVTKVEGDVTRTAFTGWFRSTPDYKPIFSPFFKKRISKPKLLGVLTPSSLEQSTAKIKKELFYRYVDSRVLIFNPENINCYALDQIGARVMNLLKKERKISTIRDTILREYNIEPKQCRKDMLFLLAELEHNGLIALEKRKI